jgi:two-component sensor histidine kinase
LEGQLVKSLRHALWIMLSLLLITSNSKAQSPYFIKIDRSNQLPSNEIYDIYQDKQGYVWIANGEGLTRYDGKFFKTYTNSEQTSKAGSNILEDKTGRIWYQNFDGYIYYVQNDSLKTLPNCNPLGFFSCAIINNDFFCIQQNGVNVIDLSNFSKRKIYKVNNLLLKTTFYDKSYFYVFEDGLLKINNKSIKRVYNNSKDFYDLRYWMVSNTNNIYMAKDSSLYQIINNKPVAKCKIPDKIKNKKHVVIDNTFWICTNNGLYYVDLETFENNFNNPYFKDKSFGAVCKDREGNLWLGTQNEGILFIPNIELKLLSLNNYRPLTLDIHRDSLYIGTLNNQILTMNLKSFMYNTIRSEYENKEVKYIYLDTLKNNIIYYSNSFYIINKKGKLIKSINTATKEVIRLDDKYFAFAASGRCGLYLDSTYSLKTSIWDKLVDGKILKSHDLKEIQFISGVRGKTVAYNPPSEIIYYGTNKGLFYIHPSLVQKKFDEIKYNNQSIFISKLLNYQDKIIAFGTFGELYMIDRENNIQKIAIKNVHANSIKNVSVLDNNIYIISDVTIGYLKPTSANSFELKKIQTYIQTSEVNDLAIYKNQLILALEKGLLMIDLHLPNNKEVKPLLAINQLTIDNKIYDYHTSPEVKYTQNDVKIDYSILSFSNQTYQLEYKINDEKWNRESNQSRELKLSSLKPGDYTVLLRLANTNQIKTLHFIIHKPYWAEYWFIALVIALIGSFAYYLYHWKIREIQQHNTLLAEKMAIEKNLNKSILASIRAQMNPHFFYNALNTIQSFIFANDKRNASAYLSKFSKLTRMILEMSERDTILLEEEILALTLYLDLEQIRFNGDFTFAINVSKNVEVNQLKIPSMIIQPYIENAIKHGLLHKKADKVLVINISTNDKFLIIEIDDNGIGRKKSGEINSHKNSKHVSFSTTANQKRIDILNADNKNIGVKYIDKIDENNEPTGTNVTISIPLMY